MSRVLRFAQVAAILLVAVSLGCTKPRPAKVAVAHPPELQRAVVPVPPAPLRVTPTRTEASLHRLGEELERLIRDPKLGVPDAVLNRTACLAAFPADEEGSGPIEGFAACRYSPEQWTSPAVLKLSSEAITRRGSDLLLFVLSDRAREKLVNGNLQLGPALKLAAGPTAHDAAILDEIKASEDVFAYVLNGELLRGVAVPRGTVAIDSAETERLYGHPLDPSSLLSSTMSSTVTSFYQIDVGSFFNTIAPSGIIIHHSVLVPGGGVKETEDVLDRFHSQRGYEVSCFGKIYHIAYHYLILPDGKVVTGRPERCEGAHARGYNSYLGVVLVGNFGSHARGLRPAHPTKAQIESLVRLCSYLRQKYSIPLQHIMPHNAVARTECPGKGLDFNKVLAAISREPGAAAWGE